MRLAIASACTSESAKPPAVITCVTRCGCSAATRSAVIAAAEMPTSATRSIANGIEHGDEVVVEVLEAVRVLALRPVRAAVAAAVHREHAKVLRQVRHRGLEHLRVHDLERLARTRATARSCPTAAYLELDAVAFDEALAAPAARSRTARGRPSGTAPASGSAPADACEALGQRWVVAAISDSSCAPRPCAPCPCVHRQRPCARACAARRHARIERLEQRLHGVERRAVRGLLFLHAEQVGELHAEPELGDPARDHFGA